MTIKSLSRFFAVIVLVCSSSGFSQDIKPLKNLSDIDSIKQDAKGSVLMINFWASWCHPCVKEFPEIVKLYNDYKDKGFKLVFISLDDLGDIDKKVLPFLKQQKVDFISYYNNLEKPDELIDYIDKKWQGAIPSTYIYDKEGVMQKSILGNRNYEQFETEITKYIN
jgi:thiol-disulfide isomerase/thioredoxin